MLRLPDCRSLKAKRSVVRGLRDRMRARFGVSAAETDFQDNPRRAEITASLVSSDYTLAESMLGKIDNMVCSDPRLLLIERRVEVFRYGGDVLSSHQESGR